MTNFPISAYEYCKPQKLTNWVDISTAKRKCVEENDCYMFYDRCGNGNEFMYCSHGAEIIPSGCGSLLYQTGKRLTFYNVID